GPQDARSWLTKIPGPSEDRSPASKLPSPRIPRGRMPDRPSVDPELAAEQAYVDAAYARLEAMRAAAERVREAYSDVRAGGTHQARLERDIAWNVTQRRLSDLDIGEAPLMFGRLDMEDQSRWYVG